MRSFKIAKKNVGFALLLCIIFLVSCSESNRNSFGDYPKQEHQPQPIDLDQYSSDHGGNGPLPSSNHQTPRIGLEVNGRIKSLLWCNHEALVEPTLTPLFSSSSEFEDEGHENDDSQISQKDKNNPRKRTFASFIFPGAIYGTADYRFRKERWYGVEQIGMIFRWNKPSSWSQQIDERDGDESTDFCAEKTGCAWLPTTLDVSAQHSVLSPSKASSNQVFSSLVDSGNVRIGWDHNDESDAIGVRSANPWVQVGLNPQRTVSDVDREQKNPVFLRFFLPLIRRRLDLQWTSHWDNSRTSFLSEKFARNGDGTANEWSSKHRKVGDDPWWIPQVSLDPSMGTLSSKNRYRSSFIGRGDRQYMTEFKLRIRTTMPTILSSVTNNVVAASEDDDLQTASLRLEYSLMTDPGERISPSLGTTCTTVRFETVVVPSFWLRSVTETSRFGLIHEQSHVTEQ